MFKSLFTIRKKKKDKHPHLIVGANRTMFQSMGITHSKKHSYRNNIELKSNVNPNDNSKSYLRKEIITDYKFKYSKPFKNYRLSEEDVNSLLKVLENKKKK